MALRAKRKSPSLRGPWWPSAVLLRVSILVAAQVSHSGSGQAKPCDQGWLVSVWRISQPCFLALESSERMTLKSVAPCCERKPPDIFCRSFSSDHPVLSGYC
jgi:hypothetical protein